MKSSLTVFLISVYLIFNSQFIQAQKGKRNYEFTPEKSTITWVGNKGEEKYSGKLKLKSGYLSLNNEELTQVVVFADVQSIDCKTCGDAESAKKLLEFMRSAEFLNVQTMDFAVFKMYKSSKIENTEDGSYRVQGVLTIIGYSNEISIPVTIIEKKKKVYVEGRLSMNRALWNLNNPTDSEVTEHIDLTIELFLKLEGEIK